MEKLTAECEDESRRRLFLAISNQETRSKLYIRAAIFFFQETGVANHTGDRVYVHLQQATRSHGIGAIKWRFVLHKASV